MNQLAADGMPRVSVDLGRQARQGPARSLLAQTTI